MKRVVRVSEPTSDIQSKIVRARAAIANQEPRAIKCPYCHHVVLMAFKDTRGHIQAKCKNCGKETVYDAIEMRRLRKNLGLQSSSQQNLRDIGNH